MSHCFLYLFYHFCMYGNQVRPVLPVFEFRATFKSSFPKNASALCFRMTVFVGMTAERFFYSDKFLRY